MKACVSMAAPSGWHAKCMISAYMSDPRKDKPLFHRVLVELDPEVRLTSESVSKGGIILPPPQDGASNDTDDVRLATVLGVGKGEYNYNTGEIRPMAVRVGDRVRVHANQVLPVRRPHDPTESTVGYVFDTDILGISSEV